MKKNYLSKIAAAMLILTIIFVSAIPAFAAKTVKLKLEIAGSDGLVYVRLTAPASSDISTISAALNYDSSKLKFKEMSYLEDPSIVNSTNSETKGTVVANTVIAESLTDESKIFTYIFEALEGNDGKYEFSFGKIKATDKNNNDINIIIDGSLKVSGSSLKPLTPDKVQNSFDPVTVPSSEAGNENAGKPSIPNTERKVLAVSAVSAAGIAAIGITAAVIKKKHSEE